MKSLMKFSLGNIVSKIIKQFLLWFYGINGLNNYQQKKNCKIFIRELVQC